MPEELLGDVPARGMRLVRHGALPARDTLRLVLRMSDLFNGKSNFIPRTFDPWTNTHKQTATTLTRSPGVNRSERKFVSEIRCHGSKPLLPVVTIDETLCRGTKGARGRARPEKMRKEDKGSRGSFFDLRIAGR